MHAALAALAFVLANLFGLIHEATTTHVRCAQHGELIDSDAASASTVRTTTVANPRATSPSRASGVDDLAAIALHGHEHCSLVSATRESRVVPRPPAIVPAAVAIGDLVAFVPRTTAPRGRLLYRTAPKTSPPATRNHA